MDWLLPIFVLSMGIPALVQGQLEMARRGLISRLESKRKSRVIVLVHRTESVRWLGLPLARYINIEDSERILRAIHLTPPDMPIDLILHTPGGLVLAAQQIACALTRHRAKVTTFIPHYAMSGGTLLALASDEIVMDENAVLGPVDPQIGTAEGPRPAVSIIKLVETKSAARVSDKTLILCDVAEKSLEQMGKLLQSILSDHYPAPKVDKANIPRIAASLLSGRWTHDHPISVEDIRELGLPVSTDMPAEIFQLMELYPQRPNSKVQYVSLPYAPPLKSPSQS